MPNNPIPSMKRRRISQTSSPPPFHQEILCSLSCCTIRRTTCSTVPRGKGAQSASGTCIRTDTVCGSTGARFASSESSSPESINTAIGCGTEWETTHGSTTNRPNRRENNINHRHMVSRRVCVAALMATCSLLSSGASRCALSFCLDASPFVKRPITTARCRRGRVRRTADTFALTPTRMVTDSKALERRERFFRSTSVNQQIFSSSSSFATGITTTTTRRNEVGEKFSWSEYLSVKEAVKNSVRSVTSNFGVPIGAPTVSTARMLERCGTVSSSRNGKVMAGGTVSVAVAGDIGNEFFSTLCDIPRRVASFTSTPFYQDGDLERVGEGAAQPSPGSTPSAGINLTPEEKELFDLLAKVSSETHLHTTLRVAGGWVRDKLLATKHFRKNYLEEQYQEEGGVMRLTAKHQQSKGRKGSSIIGGGGGTTSSWSSVAASANGKSLADHNDVKQPVDIDIALDDMLGREFADHLNEWLSTHGRETVSVGMVLKNPEKSKHLETATMKVNQFWIDFVNLRAEEYAGDSRIPDLMRIGTAEEDAFRRDLTINSLFYNINTGMVEDITGRGVEDLKRGIIATPLPPLTTLLDDPLRVLRSVRFAARLRFSMDDALRDAARDYRVREALAMKVSRERVGGEVDLMLRSLDPVGAMRLLVNLELVETVFPLRGDDARLVDGMDIFPRGLALLAETHDHLCDCKRSPPVWCRSKHGAGKVGSGYGVDDTILMDDEESRRLLWYAAFLKPLRDRAIEAQLSIEDPDLSNTKTRSKGKKSRRSIVTRMLVDELKRPGRDAEGVERIMKAADEFTALIASGGDLSATTVLLGGIRICYDTSDGGADEGVSCTMTLPGEARPICDVNPDTERDPLWLAAMDFRLTCSKIFEKIGNRWRAAFLLSLSEQLAAIHDSDHVDYAIEGDVVDQRNEDVRERIIGQYDTLAAAFIQLGLVGIWNQKPLIDGSQMKQDDVLPNIRKGPVFRIVMDEQMEWMTTHPGGSREALAKHLQRVFPDFAPR